MRTIKGVLLDVDGTLVNSNDAHAYAWVEAMADNGISVPFEKVRKLIGKGGDKLLREVASIDVESALGETINNRRAEIFQNQLLALLQPFPKARELLLRMKESGLRLAAASSSKKEELGRLLNICGADKLVEAQTSSDDAENSKPDPEIVRAALNKLRLPADQVALLGDTPYDVESGTKAGVMVIAVRCGGWCDADLSEAAAIYDDPADLLANFYSSPFAVH